MKITKILLLVLALVLALSLFACDKGNKNDTTTDAPDNITTEGDKNETTVGSEPGNDTESGNDTEPGKDTEPDETEPKPCEHVAGEPDGTDNCNVKCTKCGELLEEEKHVKGEPDPEDECNIKCTGCGKVMEKKKHTKGNADPEDHCNIKCTVCNKVLAANKHGNISVNDKCEQACEVCGDKVEEELLHETPADDAWALDPEKPQSLSASCPRCGEKAYKDATTTDKGLTLLGPDFLASCVKNARVELTVETDESGMKYCRVTSVQAGEGTITLNDGTTALMGVGEYVAVLARKSGIGNGTDIWINSAGIASPTGAKTVTMVVANDNTWQLTVYNFANAPQISKENGIGWTRFDVNPSVEIGDTMDIAYIGFFDSVDDAYAYYGSYLNAYLGVDTCAHTVDNVWKPLEDGKIGMTCSVCKNTINVMDCTHFDLTKLTNVTAKAEATTVYFTADCALCGGTGVDVPSLTQEQGRVFTASELNALAFIQASLALENNGSYSRYSAEYITNDGNLPYTRFVSKIDHENCLLLNTGGNALLGVNHYVAILYKKTGASPSIEMFITPAGENKHGNHSNKKTDTVNDGTWQLAIIDFSESTKIDTENGAGWTRLDIIDPPAVSGDTIDIAYVGFFSSVEKANEYYLAYLNAYLGKESCCHSYATDWTGTGEANKMQNLCTICGETVVLDCVHVSDGNWVETDNEGEIKSTCTICSAEFTKPCPHEDKSVVEGSGFFKSSFSCNICGYTENVEGVNSQDGLAIFTPEAIVDISVAYDGKYSNVANGEYNYSLETDSHGFKYAHHEVVRASTGEVFLYFNTLSKGVIEKAGPYFAVLVRKSSGVPNNTDVFIAADDKLSNDNVYYGKFTKNNEWHLVIYDYSACKGWNYTNGAGTIRFDILNGAGIGEGEYIDFAYAGFFSSFSSATEFYNAFAAAYGLN